MNKFPDNGFFISLDIVYVNDEIIFSFVIRCAHLRFEYNQIIGEIIILSTILIRSMALTVSTSPNSTLVHFHSILAAHSHYNRRKLFHELQFQWWFSVMCADICV